MKNFQEILKSKYKPKGEEGRLRSRRFSGKLKHRIFNNSSLRLPVSADAKDGVRVKQVADILRHPKLFKLPFHMDPDKDRPLVQGILKRENSVFLVVTKHTSHSLRHAEEFLCDIASYALELNPQADICIGGKKRPCMSCSGRMAETTIDRYGKHPGRLWLNAVTKQSSTAALQTMKLLSEKKAYATLCKDGVTLVRDYDSGSDTEDENTVLKGLLAKEPWCSLIEEERVSTKHLMRATPRELQQMMACYDIGALVSDHGFPHLLACFREDPKYLQCLEAVAYDSLADLLLDDAPGIDPIVMQHVVEEDVGIISWVRAQLCESEKSLFDVNVEEYFRASQKEKSTCS